MLPKKRFNRANIAQIKVAAERFQTIVFHDFLCDIAIER